MILAGDIGGTKTFLGLFKRDACRPAPIEVRAFPTLNYTGLPAIISEFLATHDGDTIEAAAFGVAGPVINQTAEMTNVPWRIDAAELSSALSLERIRLLNDLEAMAYSVTVLRASELKQLQVGEPKAEGNIALIAAGTGLGTSLLHRINGRYVPIASEGGHADYAARTDRELEFVRFLRGRFGRAEIEHVLSGPGLVNLSDFTHRDKRCDLSDGPDVPARVTAAALAGRCECCVEALDLFVAAYAAAAGNLALTAVTRGGVFLGGGIAPRILPALERPLFIDTFNAKSPMSPLLQAMPVHIILNDEAGLLGAAVQAQQLL
jgi:glucokinase